MVGNLVLVVAAGIAVLGLSATPALFGGELSAPLLVISFLWGAFLARVAILRHGSAAEVWRRLRRSP